MKGLFPLLVQIGIAPCEQTEVRLFTPAKELTWGSPVAGYGAVGITAALCEGYFSSKCKAVRVYLSETATSKFSVGKFLLPKQCLACTEFAL